MGCRHLSEVELDCSGRWGAKIDKMTWVAFLMVRHTRNPPEIYKLLMLKLKINKYRFFTRSRQQECDTQYAE